MFFFMYKGNNLWAISLLIMLVHELTKIQWNQMTQMVWLGHILTWHNTEHWADIMHHTWHIGRTTKLLTVNKYGKLPHKCSWRMFQLGKSWSGVWTFTWAWVFRGEGGLRKGLTHKLCISICCWHKYQLATNNRSVKMSAPTVQCP